MKKYILNLIDADISKTKSAINHATMFNNMKYGPNHDGLINDLNTKLKKAIKIKRKVTNL